MRFQLIRTEAGILKDAREKLGMTQQQVADKARIQLRQYQRFESGERNLSSSSFNIASRVINALQLDLSAYARGDYWLSEETIDLFNGKSFSEIILNRSVREP